MFNDLEILIWVVHLQRLAANMTDFILEMQSLALAVKVGLFDPSVYSILMRCSKCLTVTMLRINPTSSRSTPSNIARIHQE